MKYFVYENVTEKQYFKDFECVKMLKDVNILSTENMERMEKCISLLGKDNFANELKDLGVKFDIINFDNYTYTINNSILKLPSLSKGERILFFLCMASILEFDFIAKGFINILDFNKRHRIMQYMKNKGNGTVILLCHSDLQPNSKELGGGYYEY